MAPVSPYTSKLDGKDHQITLDEAGVRTKKVKKEGDEKEAK